MSWLLDLTATVLTSVDMELSVLCSLLFRLLFTWLMQFVVGKSCLTLVSLLLSLFTSQKLFTTANGIVRHYTISLVSSCTMYGYPAYYLIEEQLGKKSAPYDHISVHLLADPRYCGISYVEKKEVRSLLREDPQFWTYRPLSELMVCAAADDVRFLPYIFHKMIEKLIRGSLCCRCFCISDNEYADWPAISSIPEFLNAERDTLEEEILSVLDVPPGKMGRFVGRKGSSILSIKESCKAEILIGGSKGAADKVFIIGSLKQVRKAEAILRGRML